MYRLFLHLRTRTAPVIKEALYRNGMRHIAARVEHAHVGCQQRGLDCSRYGVMRKQAG